MRAERRRFSEIAGACTMASGALFLVKSVLEWRMGAPPSGDALLRWIDTQSVWLAAINELAFFAAVFSIPGLVALYRRLASTHPLHAVLSVGLLGTSIPVVVMLVVVHGRLVYPMFDLRAHTPDIAELILAVYFGGLHAIALLTAAAIVAVSRALRERDRRLSLLGWVAVPFIVVGAYPDRVGPTFVLVASGFQCAWLIGLGLHLRR